MTDKKKAILESLKGGLIVSCQVQHDDPVYSEDFVLKMANAAEWAGAVGIRANSPEQIRLIKEHVKLPMIGLYKIWHDDTDVFITPTLEAAKQVWEAGAEIIALDCTAQITHEGRPAYELLPIVKKRFRMPLFLRMYPTMKKQNVQWRWEQILLDRLCMAIRKKPNRSNSRICVNLQECAGTLVTKYLW